MAWTLVAAGALTWNLYEQRLQTLEASRIYARTVFEKDMVYRRWASLQGGLYVPVTRHTTPNPSLDGLPDRDVTTASGRQLTLVNPAYMTRQVHELEAKEYGVRGHITSLNPIRAENAPDDWETRALTAFLDGEKEVSSTEELDGKPYMRLMRPLVTEKSCLRCHADQGYQLGDIRGGISVSVPMEPLLVTARKHGIALCLGHSLLWAVGLGGIAYGTKCVRRNIERSRRVERALHESEIEVHTLGERNARIKAEQTLLAAQEKLRMARSIQEKLLPDAAPELPGLEIGGVSNPAEFTSGDYFDYITLSDGNMGIVIADVSGHGIGPALLATETCAYLRALARTCSDVGEILTCVN
jgi:hypothetical protein